jgi:bifunctional UDP-N-acetylglucosamine pyrophosphorylase/glucosamine-1-phosphate N-acetyltransferase
MAENLKLNDNINALMQKGVRIPCPYSIEIGDDVDVRRISGYGIVLHSGTKLFGAQTTIGSGAVLGYESPLTAVNCQIGSGVELGGGFCRESLFLEGVRIASGAQIREGCILEEGVRVGHNVGLKQTILFPFVTLGSLINFCDCLMAGGTSPKDHSEVGSSYIHFNYTPYQDKATPSLIGDVPRGVMINQPPVFLGGQGGLVGPVRIGYGTVARAGSIVRKDSPEGGKLIGSGESLAEKTFSRDIVLGDVERKVRNNIHYLASLLVLRQWYVHVRRHFFRAREFGEEMNQGAGAKLEMALFERLQRLREFIESAAGHPFIKNIRWPELVVCFTSKTEEKTAERERDNFIGIIEKRILKAGPDYLPVIQGLLPREVSLGTEWLQTVLDDIVARASAAIGSPRGPRA